MSLAIINGLLTSIALETFILSKQMILSLAFKTAIGMSFISMVAMETAMNVTDVLLTDKPLRNSIYVDCRFFNSLAI